MRNTCVRCGAMLPKEYVEEDICLCDHCIDDFDDDTFTTDIGFPVNRQRDDDEDELCVDWLS